MSSDPLLDLRSRGLAVEGLDSSADMLDRCRAQQGCVADDTVFTFVIGPHPS